MKPQIIAVGTKNPAKLKAATEAFEKVWPEKKWQVVACEVASGIPAQPMSDEEAIEGATNRAKRALALIKEATYGVGLEGGLSQVGEDWFDCGWAVVVNREGMVGKTSSARIPTPEMMMKLIREGKELGEVLDILMKRENVKQAEGHVGILTNKTVTRTDIYRDGLIIALGRFLHPELF